MNEIIISTGALLRILVVVALLTAILTAAVAALAIVLRIRGTRLRRKLDDWHAEWRPRVFDIVTGCGQPEMLLAGVTKKQRPHLLSLLLETDALLRGSARARLRSLGTKLLKPADRAGLSARSPGERACSVRLHAVFAREECRESLWQMLDDPSPLVVSTTAHALIQTGRPEDAGHVLEKAAEFTGWDRRLLASMLTAIGPDAAHYLAETLLDEEQPRDLRVAAAEALRWLGAPSGASAAPAVLSRSNDREIQASCLRLLGRVGSASHAPLILPFCHDEDEIVRIHAVSAYARVSSESSAVLSAASGDASRWVAARARAGLRAAGLGVSDSQERRTVETNPGGRVDPGEGIVT